jgi:hypothetical protein
MRLVEWVFIRQYWNDNWGGYNYLLNSSKRKGFHPGYLLESSDTVWLLGSYWWQWLELDWVYISLKMGKFQRDIFNFVPFSEKILNQCLSTFFTFVYFDASAGD